LAAIDEQPIISQFNNPGLSAIGSQYLLGVEGATGWAMRLTVWIGRFLDLCYEFDQNPAVCGLGKDNLAASGLSPSNSRWP
jgi:hypothetical protein